MNREDRTIVSVDGLVKHFRSAGSVVVPAVDGVTFTVPEGKLVAIRGASGCGKTTLLNLLGALDKPTAGSIVVDGVKVSEVRGKDEVGYRRKKVGFVFQSYHLIPNLSALENVMLPMGLLGMKRGKQQARARELLDRVGIDAGRQARRPARLSGGEQQRVAIARALANDPAIILGDEPTGNLDSKTGDRIIELLQNLAHEGKTIILATHDAAIAARADFNMEMSDGKLFSGSHQTTSGPAPAPDSVRRDAQ